MPLVFVYYDSDQSGEEYYRGVIDETVMETVSNTIKREGSKLFSRPGLQLTPDDFSVMFVPAGKHDSLSCDIVVSVHLHAFSERVGEQADSNAGRLAVVIAAEIDKLFVEDDFTIGVALEHTEMGWSKYTLQANGRVAEWPGDR